MFWFIGSHEVSSYGSNWQLIAIASGEGSVQERYKAISCTNNVLVQHVSMNWCRCPQAHTQITLPPMAFRKAECINDFTTGARLQPITSHVLPFERKALQLNHIEIEGVKTTSMERESTVVLGKYKILFEIGKWGKQKKMYNHIMRYWVTCRYSCMPN